jgi:hypothetical protein
MWVLQAASSKKQLTLSNTPTEQKISKQKP